MGGSAMQKSPVSGVTLLGLNPSSTASSCVTLGSFNLLSLICLICSL